MGLKAIKMRDISLYYVIFEKRLHDTPAHHAHSAGEVYGKQIYVVPYN